MTPHMGGRNIQHMWLRGAPKYSVSRDTSTIAPHLTRWFGLTTAPFAIYIYIYIYIANGAVYGAEVWQIPTREINKILST